MAAPDFPKVSSDSALAAFNSGFNCAQSVVKVFADALGFDEKEAVSKAAKLGGGRFQGVCGAVSGAYLVLEMFCTQKSIAEEEKLCIETLKNNFIQQFQQIYDTHLCKELLRNDAARPTNSPYSICERCIVDAVKIINHLLN